MVRASPCLLIPLNIISQTSLQEQQVQKHKVMEEHHGLSEDTISKVVEAVLMRLDLEGEVIQSQRGDPEPKLAEKRDVLLTLLRTQPSRFLGEAFTRSHASSSVVFDPAKSLINRC